MSAAAPDDLRWRASCKASQLRALLGYCYGVNQGAFEELDPEQRDSILWLAGDLANDIEELIDKDMIER
jgi:hypothetical protein